METKTAEEIWQENEAAAEEMLCRSLAQGLRDAVDALNSKLRACEEAGMRVKIGMSVDGTVTTNRFSDPVRVSVIIEKLMVY